MTSEVANLQGIGANLLLVDYRGYGSSTPLGPGEKRLTRTRPRRLITCCAGAGFRLETCSCLADRSAAARLRTHFDNLKKIRLVHIPVLIVAGVADTLTPIWMADRIFAQANQPKQFYPVPGAGHNDLVTSGGIALRQALRKFVRQKR